MFPESPLTSLPILKSGENGTTTHTGVQTCSTREARRSHRQQPVEEATLRQRKPRERGRLRERRRRGAGRGLRIRSPRLRPPLSGQRRRESARNEESASLRPPGRLLPPPSPRASRCSIDCGEEKEGRGKGRISRRRASPPSSLHLSTALHISYLSRSSTADSTRLIEHLSRLRCSTQYFFRVPFVPQRSAPPNLRQLSRPISAQFAPISDGRRLQESRRRTQPLYRNPRHHHTTTTTPIDHRADRAPPHATVGVCTVPFPIDD